MASKMGVAKVIRLFINISANIYRRIIYFISFKEHKKYSLEKKSFPLWKLLVIFKEFKQIKLHKKKETNVKNYLKNVFELHLSNLM